MNRHPRTPITVTITRNPDPYWQGRFGQYVREEAEKRGMYVPSPAEVREVMAERAELTVAEVHPR